MVKALIKVMFGRRLFIGKGFYYGQLWWSEMFLWAYVRKVTIMTQPVVLSVGAPFPHLLLIPCSIVVM